MADPMAMLHFKREIAPAILLVVDFGAWFKLEPRSSYGHSPEMIQHTQVSLLKDVIVPYTHLFPALHLSENQPRHNLLYFKGGKHRSRVSIVSLQLIFVPSLEAQKNMVLPHSTLVVCCVPDTLAFRHDITDDTTT